jgi:hypothetical protein
MWPSDDLKSHCDLTQLPFTQASREVLANAAEVSASSYPNAALALVRERREGGPGVLLVSLAANESSDH